MTFSDADDESLVQTKKISYSRNMENNADENLRIHALADGELSIEAQRQLMARVLASPALLDKLGCILRQNRIIRDRYTTYIKRNSH